MSEQAARALAGYGRRTYTRNGWRFAVQNIRAEDNRLHLVVRAREIATGKEYLGPGDEPFDELIIVNPRTHVDDGEEPNPEAVLDPAQPPMRRKRRLDVIEALKAEIDRFLERRLDA